MESTRLREIFALTLAALPTAMCPLTSRLPVSAAWFGAAANPGIAELNAFLKDESARRGYSFIDLNPVFAYPDGALAVDARIVISES